MRMRNNHVLRVIGKALMPLILLFALYVQFHGDYGPGGGFQAGVIFASGLILYCLIFGVAPTRKILSLTLLRRTAACGVLLFGGTGLACIARGGNFLEYGAFTPHHPLHGQHLGLVLIELGVGITVASVMLIIFYCFFTRGQ